MHKNRMIVIFILFLRFCRNCIDCYSFEAKTITLNRHSGCSQDAKNAIRFNGTFANIAQNVYAINGEFVIRETIVGPIDVKFINIFIYDYYKL